MIKRCCDVFLVLISMPVMLPLLGVVSAVVMLSSPGPIFYSHRRIRKSGAFFSMWKFRTMCVNSAEVLDDYLARNPEAHAEWNETHKLRKDPRITPLGGFLRRYSLDELPQLWNIFRGEMSLVGPRPERPFFCQLLEERIPLYALRHCVRPGLTGWAQVKYQYGSSVEDAKAKLEYDFFYIKHVSPLLDLAILFETAKVVLRRRGAK